MDFQDVKQVAINAVCAGVVAGAVAYFVLGADQSVEYFGMQLNASVAIGIAGAAGSVTSDLFSGLVIQKLGLNTQLSNGASLAVQTGVGSVTAAAALYFGGGLPSEMLLQALGVGAVGKLGGDWLAYKAFDSIDGVFPL